MTHDEKIVEAVARAIYEDRNGKGCKAWAHQPKAHQAPYMSDARAAITAFQAEAWQPTMVKLTPEDERLLNKALLASTDVLYPILPVEPEDGWRDISTADKGAGWMLLFSTSEGQDVGRWEPTYGVDGDWMDAQGYTIWNVTHWQPLPPAPKATP